MPVLMSRASAEAGADKAEHRASKLRAKPQERKTEKPRKTVTSAF